MNAEFGLAVDEAVSGMSVQKNEVDEVIASITRVTQVATMRAPPFRRAKAAVMAIGLAFGVASAAFACGYDNPQVFALGTLNWAYPYALYVRTAVWQAEDAGLLPPRGEGQASGPFAFYRAAAIMKRLGASLAQAKLAETGMAISVVVIPQVMWTRFEADPEGKDVYVKSHIVGPASGDVVIVTNEKVVRALVDGNLDADTAEAHGLLRIYGGREQITNIRTVLTKAAKHSSAAARTEP